ncbi:transferrin-binding protein-like solute binding protein [Lonepinella sp. MS14436]|uniref:transferrin-binding protein-like solute binding protein n=1 Tax=Lonepinella sp. MS14436 TaxID=3003619 RepID=UPI0036D7C877
MKPIQIAFKLSAIASVVLLAGVLSACSTSNPVEVRNDNPTANNPMNNQNSGGSNGGTTDSGSSGSSSGSGTSDNTKPTELSYIRGKIPTDATQVSGSYVERVHGQSVGNPIDQSDQTIPSGEKANIEYTEKLGLSGKDTKVAQEGDYATFQGTHLSERIAEQRAKDQDFFTFVDDDASGSNKWGYLSIMRVYGINLDSALWGINVGVPDSPIHHGDYAFAQGFATDNAQIPTSGTAKYKGRAVLQVGEAGKYLATGPDDDHNISVKNVKIGDAEFDVDFDKKSLDGKITATNQNFFTKPVESNVFDPISLSAKISDNRFVGEKNGVTTNGQFYGENAQEMAGIFSNPTQNLFGSYGAKKGLTEAQIPKEEPKKDDQITDTKPDPVPEPPKTQEKQLVGTQMRFNDDDNIALLDSHKVNNYIIDSVTVNEDGSLNLIWKHEKGGEKVNDTLKTYNLVDLLSNPSVPKEAKYDYQNLINYPEIGYVYIDEYYANLLNLKHGYVAQKRSGYRSTVLGEITPTENMPTSGVINYKGLAAVGNNIRGKQYQDVIHTGTAEFQADLDNKKLTGTITPDTKTASQDYLDDYAKNPESMHLGEVFYFNQVKPISLSAHINGAEFAGTDQESKMITKGMFVGQNADEVIGRFSRDTANEEAGTTTHTSGVFGAKKQ